MSEINIEFTLSKDEYLSFNRIMTGPGVRRNNIVLLIIVSFACAATCFSFGKVDIMTVVCWAVLYIFAVFFSSVSMKRAVKTAYDKSKRLKANRKIEFFNDHIETMIQNGREDISSTNAHYPLEAIKGVFENGILYVFVISPLEAIIIPKRALLSEQEEKLHALIMNMYPNSYKRL